MKKLRQILPGYAVLPLIAMLALNFFTYNVTPLLTRNMTHVNMETILDDRLPFLPVFVLPYVLAFAQWGIGYLAIARTDKAFCYRIFFGEMLAKLMVCALFILFPATMGRPEVTQTDVLSRLVAFIYRLDPPRNLFPSIHCLESWFCYRGACNRKYFGGLYRNGMLLMTVLVFLSTVLIKQHVVADMAAAVVVAELGLWLSGRLPWVRRLIQTEKQR